MSCSAIGKIVAVLSVTLLLFIQQVHADTSTVRVRGAVKHPLALTLNDLEDMPPSHISALVRIEEKATLTDPEKDSGTDRYSGVLLRDILEKAGMKYVRKWEPGVYIRVKGEADQEAVFSFGEIFYSSSGRSILLAYEKSGSPIKTEEGLGELAIATDVRAGRFVKGIKEIIVERVDIPMIAYDDKKKKVVRPPTNSLSIIDHRTSKSREFKPEDLDSLPGLYIRNALMAGDCEGFNGVYAFEGPLLRSILEWFGLFWENRDYGRYVVISSEDGFCATFSMGELFNSRLDNNIIIAKKKGGELLGPNAGFATSVVGEDSTGGRSVKRIKRIEIY